MLDIILVIDSHLLIEREIAAVVVMAFSVVCPNVPAIRAPVDFISKHHGTGMGRFAVHAHLEK